MGSVFRAYKSIEIPEGAAIKNGIVTWSAAGKTRKGKLTKNGKVSFQVETWSVLYTDEKGKTHRIAAKTKNRGVAEKILANYEAEVDRIRAGVVTREELTRVQDKHLSIDEALERFRTKMVASGITGKHIDGAMQQILSLVHDIDAETIAKIRREDVERWIANEIQRKVRSVRTINSYIVSIKSFAQYLWNVNVLPDDPLKPIRKLNQELDRRKIRRAMTADEVERLLQAATKGNCRAPKKAKEQVLIYRLLVNSKGSWDTCVGGYCHWVSHERLDFLTLSLGYFCIFFHFPAAFFVKRNAIVFNNRCIFQSALRKAKKRTLSSSKSTSARTSRCNQSLLTKKSLPNSFMRPVSSVRRR